MAQNGVPSFYWPNEQFGIRIADDGTIDLVALDGAVASFGLGAEGYPAPWVSLGVRATWPDRDIDQIPDTCALDVADRGGSTFEEIASVMNISNERAQQIVRKALWRSDGPTRSLGLSDVSQECARQTGEAPNARCMGSDPEQGCGQPRGRKA